MSKLTIPQRQSNQDDATYAQIVQNSIREQRPYLSDDDILSLAQVKISSAPSVQPTAQPKVQAAAKVEVAKVEKPQPFKSTTEMVDKFVPKQQVVAPKTLSEVARELANKKAVTDPMESGIVARQETIKRLPEQPAIMPSLGDPKVAAGTVKMLEKFIPPQQPQEELPPTEIGGFYNPYDANLPTQENFDPAQAQKVRQNLPQAQSVRESFIAQPQAPQVDIFDVEAEKQLPKGSPNEKMVYADVLRKNDDKIKTFEASKAAAQTPTDDFEATINKKDLSFGNTQRASLTKAKFGGDMSAIESSLNEYQETPEFKRDVIKAANGNKAKFNEAAQLVLDNKANEYAFAPTKLQKKMQQFSDWAAENNAPLYATTKTLGAGLKGLTDVGAFGAALIGGTARSMGQVLDSKEVTMLDNFAAANAKAQKMSSGYIPQVQSEKASGLTQGLSDVTSIVAAIGTPMAAIKPATIFTKAKNFLSLGTRGESAIAKGLSAEAQLAAKATSGANKTLLEAAKTLQSKPANMVAQVLDGAATNWAIMGSSSFDGQRQKYLDMGFNEEQANRRAFGMTSLTNLLLAMPNVLRPHEASIAQKIFSTGSKKEALKAGLKQAAYFGGDMTLLRNIEGTLDDNAKRELGIKIENTPFSESIKENGKKALIDAGAGLVMGLMARGKYKQSEMQLNGIAEAFRNPEQLSLDVQKEVAKGRLSKEQAKTFQDFLTTIEPQYLKTLNETTEVNGKQSPKYSPTTAVKIAIEKTKVQQATEALKNLNASVEKKTIYETDKNGNIVEKTVYRHKDGKLYETEETATKGRRASLLRAKSTAEERARRFEAGYNIENKLVSGWEMADLVDANSLNGKAKEGQREAIMANAPYEAVEVNVNDFAKQPEIAELVSKIESGKLDVTNVEENNIAPPTIDAEGNVIDGKKIIAKAIVESAFERGGGKITFMKPITNEAYTEAANEAFETKVGDTAPITEGLPENEVIGVNAMSDAFDKVIENGGDAAQGLVEAAKEGLQTFVEPQKVAERLKDIKGEDTFSEPIIEAAVNKAVKAEPIEAGAAKETSVGGDAETSQQIENFGVNKKDVEPVRNVISQVFNSLKNAGLTTAKTVGDWVGIGKGEEKPYSLKINGKDVQVKNVQPEVVNGFYSPLEKTINETKFDKLPAKQWIDKFGKSEEAKWTGLADWLQKQDEFGKSMQGKFIIKELKNGKFDVKWKEEGGSSLGLFDTEKQARDFATGSVSKLDIQNYLKNNKIEIIEVVKSDDLIPVELDFAKKDFDVDDYNATIGGNEEIEYVLEDKEVGYEIIKTDESFYVRDNRGENIFKDGDYNNEIKSLEDAKNVAGLNLAENNKRSTDDTKFSQYQLEGEKENYKEVLVTMPSKSKLTLAKFLKDLDISNEEYNLRKRSYDLAYEQEVNKQSEKFKSSHFDEPNILVHLRMNTRTDAQGNKVLFLEEVQSDWGQQGKKEGFNTGKVSKVKIKTLSNINIEESDFFDNAYISYNPEGSNVGRNLGRVTNLKKNKYEAVQNTEQGVETKIGEYKSRKEAIDALLESEIFEGAEKTLLSKPSQAPFVMDTNAWTKLGLKVALKEAVKQGADKIAWTTGEQQNDRYDLRKQVDSINYLKNEDGTYQVYGKKGDNIVFKEKALAENKLEGSFGKDVAEKIINDKGNSKEGLATKILEGDNLSVGGKGMKGFYGSLTEGAKGIVGGVAEKLFKQQLGEVKFSSPKNQEVIDAYNRARSYGNIPDALVEKYEKAKGLQSTQPSIDITPELKASVESGQPLFKDAEAQYRIENGKNIVEAIRDFDGSPRATVALTHEIMHPTVVAIIDGAKNGNKVGAKHTETIVNEFNKANPKSQVTIEQLIEGNDAFKDGATSKQYRAVQEFIAKSWEKYHKEGGKGFSESFQKVLEQITQAFKSVYKSISDKELTPELRKMFDDILSKEAAKEIEAKTVEQLRAEEKAEMATIDPNDKEAAKEVYDRYDKLITPLLEKEKAAAAREKGIKDMSIAEKMRQKAKEAEAVEEKPIEEPNEEAVVETPKDLSLTQVKHNRLAAIKKSYNALTKSKKSSEQGKTLMRQINGLATELGYEVGIKNKGDGSVKVLNSKGSDIKAIAVKSELPKPSNIEVERAKFLIEKGIAFYGGDVMSERTEFTSLTRAEVEKGVADIEKGKMTIPAIKLIKELNEMYESKTIPTIQGGGGSSTKRGSIELDKIVEDGFPMQLELTEKDIQFINENEATLAEEYDAWYKGLSNIEKLEHLNIVTDAKETENRKAEINASGEGEANVSNEKDAREKEQQKSKLKEASSFIRDAAAKLREQHEKEINDPNAIQRQGGLSKKQVAIALEKLADIIDTVNDVEKAIKQFLDGIKDPKERTEYEREINNFFVEEYGEKEEVKPVPFAEIPKARVKEIMVEGNKVVDKTLENRLMTGETADSTKQEVEKKGLERVVDDFITAEANANNIVEKYGYNEALAMAIEGEIDGAARSAILGMEYLRRDNAVRVAKTATELRRATEDLAEWISYVGYLQAKGGSANAYWGKFYADNPNLGLTLKDKIDKWEQTSGKAIPIDIKEKYEQLDTQLKEALERVKELEEQAPSDEMKSAIKAIQEQAANKGRKPSTSGKEFAAKIRKLKIKPIELKDADGNPILDDKGKPVVLQMQGLSINEFVEVAAKAAEKSDSIIDGFNAIRENLETKDWFKTLTKKDKESIQKQIENAFEESMGDTSVEGNPITNSLIRDYVLQGFNTPEKLLEKLMEHYPNKSERNVRDLVSKYGQEITKTADEIDREISLIKNVFKTESQLEDIAQGVRPKKRVVPQALTFAERAAEEVRSAKKRRNLKNVRQALDKLNVDLPALDNELRNKLDKQEATLSNKIKDLELAIEDGKEITKNEKTKLTSEEIERLELQLDETRKVYNEVFGKDVKSEKVPYSLDAVNNAIYENNKKLKGAQEDLDVVKKRGQDTAKIEADIERYSKNIETLSELRKGVEEIEAKRLLQTFENLAKRKEYYEQRKASGQYAKKPKNVLPETTELTKARSEVDRLKFEEQKLMYLAEKQAMSGAAKVGELISGIWNVPRLALATGEWSFVGMQGRRLTASYLIKNPKVVKEAFKNAAKSWYSGELAQELESRIKNSPEYHIYKGSGLDLTEQSFKTAANEEIAYNNIGKILWRFLNSGDLLAEKIYKYKTGKDLGLVEEVDKFNPLVKFERAASGYLNTLRFAAMTDMVSAFKQEGLSFEKNKETYKAAAKYINTATGRGSIKQLEQSSEILAKFFFSPKMFISEIQLATNPLGGAYLAAMKDPTGMARKEAFNHQLRYMSVLLGAGLSATILAYLRMGRTDENEDGTGVEFNPASANFGKIVFPNNRTVDFFNGAQRYVVVADRLFGQEKFKNRKGAIKDIGIDRQTPSKWDVIANIPKNKLNPALGFLTGELDAATRKDGLKYDDYGNVWNTEDEFAKLLSPIFAQMMNNAYEQDPTILDGFGAFMAFFGKGFNVQEKEVPKPPKFKKRKSNYGFRYNP
jgi:hypothetical protein